MAAVALIGYLLGYRTRKSSSGPSGEKLTQQLSSATQIAQHLQQIASRIRQDVASHQTNIAQFKSRLGNLESSSNDEGWQQLSTEAEKILVPTMKFVTDLSLAYDQMRKQSLQLMSFAGSRTDPQTGIHNRRAMEEQFDILFSLHERNQSPFSMALFSIDWSDDKSIEGDEVVREFAEVLQNCAHDTDFVARYSPEEFVILMPQTRLAGATIFSERLLSRVDSQAHLVLAGGIAEIQRSDHREKMLSRADSALYSARANGFSCLYQHNGQHIRPHEIHLGPFVSQTLEVDIKADIPRDSLPAGNTPSC